MRPLKVSILASQSPGLAPNQRFRFEQWLRLLPEGTVDARVLPLFGPSVYARLYEPGGAARKAAQTGVALARRIVQLREVRHADVVVIVREAFPLGPAVLESFVERRVPVVFDFDDAIFLPEASAANQLAGRFKVPGRVAGIIGAAAATTAGNEYLATYARRFGSNVHVIPTTIDVDEYRPQLREARELVRVGWSGSATTSKHLRSIEGALRRMLAELPVELVVIGDPAFRLDGAPRVRVLPWRAEREIAEVGAFDVGLMPLPDDEWSRGKCGFKALLYMALGVAPVVSPVGVNTDIVASGNNGLLATTADEWVEAVGALVEDAALRRKLGDAGRDTVVSRYSGQRWAPKFLEVLREAADWRAG